MKQLNLFFNLKTLITIVVLSVLITACKKGGSTVDELLEGKDLKAMKVKSDQLKASSDSLLNLATKLDQRIFDLDEANRDYKLVDALEIKSSTYNHYINLQANIEADDDAEITPEYSGVIRLRVKEGQYVGKGAILGVIDDGGLKAQLNQSRISVTQAQSQVTQAQVQVTQAESRLQNAQIQADLAKTTFIKQQNLWNQKIGSEMQYLQAKTNYESAEKQVDVARKDIDVAKQQVKVAQQQVSAAQQGVTGSQDQLDKTYLRAPFSGVVDKIITESGQVVGPGTRVLRLVNPGRLKVTAEVPENYLPEISVGTNAFISIPSIHDTIAAKVSLVSPSINPNNRTFEIEIPVSDKRAKPNQNAEIRLNHYSKDSAIVIPEASIKYDANGSYVYVINNTNGNEGRVKKTVIETGLEANSEVEVLSGLKAGDKIVTDGVNQVQDGDLIKTSVQ